MDICKQAVLPADRYQTLRKEMISLLKKVQMREGKPQAGRSVHGRTRLPAWGEADKADGHL